ncbi:MAG: hypothetical protein BHV96_04515 [Clostridium sp. CAG:354_28_25]|nr:MAG: hypothetical protein BHV96_04515 [Clostridium sp. CAG:354_28_25]
MSRSGIVNVRMVITEEKILSNIEKVHKMINPKSKKQIIQLDDDTYFKDLVEAIKTYLVEYPKKQNFPASVYNAAFNLVEFATSQFEDNTKQIESLIRQRELNISLGGKLKELLKKVETKEKNWKEAVKEAQDDFDEDIINTLLIIGRSRSKETDHYKDALKLLKARISNLESNLHIEIDMERIEDRSKALSYIGLEIADALKEIPAPAEEVVEEQVEPIVEPIQKAKKVKAKKEKKVNVAAIAEPSNVEKVEQPKVETIQKVEEPQEEQYVSETFEAKPSLWQRFKNSKFVRTIKYIMSIRVVLEVPALPEGKTEN